MERLRSVFQLSMLLLLSLSAAMFSAAEASPLVALTIPVCVLAWLAIERPRRSGLGPVVSLLLGLAAVAAAAAEFLSGDIEARLLAPAHLLAYFLWIIVLQRKEHRHYWMLLGLSVLQIALTTLLTSAAWLGLAMVLYAALTLWTMGIFTLYRAAERIHATIEEGALPDSAPAGGRRGFNADGWRGWRAARSTVRNAVQVGPDENMVGWRFAGGASVAAVLSLLVAAAFFLLIPRVWTTQYQLFDNSPLAGGRSLTGFTSEVTLGDMGEILENDDLVMQIELFDYETDEAIPAGEYLQRLGGPDPLFRGQVLENYLAGRWTRIVPERWSAASRNLPEGRLLRQHILLEPIGSPMLFGAGRVIACIPAQSNEPIWKERDAGIFKRAVEGDTSRLFEYDAISLAGTLQPRYVDDGYLQNCLRVPRGMERVRDLSVQILSARDRPNLTEQEAVELIESYLRDSPEFSYSLDLSIEDPSVDPVVDFLFNRRRGHCEYYASALTLMIRSVGIPSRMVSGFKGGHVNPRTDRFEVRQLHAHAWTEAFVDGRWIALDPTPPAREASVAALEERSDSPWSRMRERWSQVWDQGVRLSKSDQEELVYAPLRQGFSGAVDAVRDLRGTGSRLGAFLRSLATSPDRWFSWRGGVAAFVLLLLAAGLITAGRRIARWLGRLRGRTTQHRRGAVFVPFYERFRKAAARAGMERASAQTQREFAALVRERVRRGPVPASLDDVPADVAAGFYRVRFGGESLSEGELENLRRRLDEFESRLAQFRQNGSAHAPQRGR